MLIGHQKQQQFLKKAVELQKIPHAFLFSGERHLGKKTIAIEFAKLVNCSSSDFSKKPCQNCQNCKDIEKRIHPDLILIKPQSQKGEIQISQIRDLILKFSLHPYSFRYKIAIISKAHSMNQEAQSCFLKILEEPKGESVLILTTEYPEMLLPTIVSRTQKIKFFEVSKKEIEKYLILKNVSNEETKYLNYFSGGKPGAVVNFLSDSKVFLNQKRIVSDLSKIMQSGLSFKFQYVKNLIKEDDGERKSDLSSILNIWQSFLRNVLLNKIQEKDKNLPEEEIFGKINLEKIKNIIKSIQSTNFLISRTNVNQKLALELLLMEF